MRERERQRERRRNEEQRDREERERVGGEAARGWVGKKKIRESFFPFAYYRIRTQMKRETTNG